MVLVTNSLSLLYFVGHLLEIFASINYLNHYHRRFKFPSDWDITHSPKHWSNEEMMLQYIKAIIIAYVEKQKDNLGGDKSALVIMDDFKGQITPRVNAILEENSIHICLLPANTTDLLQPMDLSVNKPVKDFLRRKFKDWYLSQIAEQLDQEPDIEAANLEMACQDISAHC